MGALVGELEPAAQWVGRRAEDACDRVGVGHVLQRPVAVEPGEPGRHREHLPHRDVGNLRAHVGGVVGQQLAQGGLEPGDVALLDGDPDQRRQDAGGGRVDVPVGVGRPVVVPLQHGLPVDEHDARRAGCRGPGRPRAARSPPRPGLPGPPAPRAWTPGRQSRPRGGRARGAPWPRASAPGASRFTSPARAIPRRGDARCRARSRSRGRGRTRSRRAAGRTPSSRRRR